MYIHPIRLTGVWTDGAALDKHTLSSTYIGQDENGHDRYDNTYSEVGSLVKRLKYRQEYSVVDELACVASYFIKEIWKIHVDLIVPVPPTKIRNVQPVFLIVKKIGEYLNIPVCTDFFTKHSTTESKSLTAEEKRQLLGVKIKRNKILTYKENVLIIDDLFDSGATLTAVCNEFKKDPNLNNVYVLTMTKTRKV